MVAMRTSSPAPPFTRMRPPGSATKLPPQNSMPPAGSPSWPTRLTAQTYTPLAMAWLRWIVSQAACCCAPYSAFSGGSQPMAVG